MEKCLKFVVISRGLLHCLVDYFAIEFLLSQAHVTQSDRQTRALRYRGEHAIRRIGPTLCDSWRSSGGTGPRPLMYHNFI